MNRIKVSTIKAMVDDFLNKLLITSKKAGLITLHGVGDSLEMEFTSEGKEQAEYFKDQPGPLSEILAQLEGCKEGHIH